MRRTTAGFITALLLFTGAHAQAAVMLHVAVGWDGIYRYGRWTPVYITAADDSARPARLTRLEIVAPHVSGSNLRIQQTLTLRPAPSTFLVYVPLTENLMDTVAVLRDAQSGARLAEKSLDPMLDNARRDRVFTARDSEEVVVGVNGQPSELLSAQSQLKWERRTRTGPHSVDIATVTLRAGRLSQEHLPDMALGYDGLDLLVLSAPSLVGMRPEAEQAIAAWVRGGGRLLLWMGDGLVPPQSEIAALLPCDIEGLTSIDLSTEETRQLGLLPRIERVSARELSPRPRARETKVLGGKASLWQRDAGLGLAAVLSVNAAPLAFDSDDGRRRFWEEILNELLQNPNREERRFASPWGTQEDAQRAAAMEAVIERLGDVPGVGRFDFSYIALVMVGLMLVVGPVDWIVLRKLGRQPWTWATTTGWIALVTFGAIYVGHVFRSGDLHYRTLRMVEQVDGQVVASLDMASIYAPRTGTYAVECPPQSWWEPASIASPYSNRDQRGAPELRMAQDLRGTRPLPMSINVWSLRFLIGEMADTRSDAAAIGASLRVETRDDSKLVVGTLTNLSPATLYEVRILTGDQGAVVRGQGSPIQGASDATLGAGIKPGETIQVSVPLQPAGLVIGTVDRERLGQVWLGNTGVYSSGPVPFLRAALDLRPLRSTRTAKLLESRSDLACVVAEGLLPEARTRLAEGGHPVQQHWLAVRALVEMR